MNTGAGYGNKMRAVLHTIIHVACIVLIICFTSAGSAVSDETGVSTGRNWMALPVVFYTSDTGFGTGLASIGGYHAERARLSTLQFLAIVTTKKQSEVALKWDHYLRRMRDRIGVTAEYSKFPTYYYGIGNDTENDDPGSFTPEYLTLEMFYERVLFRQFSLKTLLYLRNQAIVKGREDAIAQAPFHRGRLDAGPAVALVWDNRDNTNATRHGTLVQLEYAGYIARDQGGAQNQLTLDMRHFMQPARWLVLASQGFYREARGTVPFYLMPYLGGQDRLRGYEQRRYIGRSVLLVQQDARFDITGPLGGVLFVAAGQAAGRFRDLFDSDFHLAYGGGLRYYFNREDNMAVRLDYALSEDSDGLYITFGEAF